VAEKGGTIAHEGAPNPAPPMPRTLKERPDAGKGGANRAHMDAEHFPGSGARNPPTDDGNPHSTEGETMALPQTGLHRVDGEHTARETKP
jgi:hypothetical protein